MPTLRIKLYLNVQFCLLWKIQLILLQKIITMIIKKVHFILDELLKQLIIYSLADHLTYFLLNFSTSVFPPRRPSYFSQ